MTERKLPKLASFTLRVDSSLGEGLQLSEEASAQLCSEAVASGEAGSTAEVCLRMLPKLESLAAAHSQEQVRIAPAKLSQPQTNEVISFSCPPCRMSA